jgi:signal peptidase I
MLKALADFFLDVVSTVLIAIAIFLVVYFFLVKPHQVIGESMEPTFETHQYILTDLLSYRFRNPERGDVIVFRAPQDQTKDLIKRVIGLPGEKIRFSGGKVIISSSSYPQGFTLNEPYINDNSPTKAESATRENEDYVIPPGKYFVMGDNREHSSDSRDFGAVDNSLIIGRAWLRYWPLNVVSFIPGVAY